jgi:hypothetical protein
MDIHLFHSEDLELFVLIHCGLLGCNALAGDYNVSEKYTASIFRAED